MRRLFTTHALTTKGVMLPSGWNTVSNNLRHNVNKIVTFYRNNVMSVQGNHFLVKLLQSITIPLRLPADRYCDNVDALAYNLSMALNMTSGIFPGRVHRNVFYGNDSPEILLVNNESFDPLAMESNWENIVAVKVLRHPVSNLTFLLPDGKATTPEHGFATIEINIPLLALQWRCFFMEQLKNPTIVANKGTLGEVHFIHMYVLPNMLYSHVEQVLFNRFLNYQTSRPLPPSNKHHSFALPDYTRQLDSVIGIVLDNLKKVKQDFNGILQNTPALFHSSMDPVMLVPDVARTRQVEWALYLTRLPCLLYMLEASNQDPAYRNRQDINYFKRLTLSLHSNSVLHSVLDGDSYIDAMFELDDINTALEH